MMKFMKRSLSLLISAMLLLAVSPLRRKRRCCRLPSCPTT